jgi:hypothetical protein
MQTYSINRFVGKVSIWLFAAGDGRQTKKKRSIKRKRSSVETVDR